MAREKQAFKHFGLDSSVGGADLGQVWLGTDKDITVGIMAGRKIRDILEMGESKYERTYERSTERSPIIEIAFLLGHRLGGPAGFASFIYEVGDLEMMHANPEAWRIDTGGFDQKGNTAERQLARPNAHRSAVDSPRNQHKDTDKTV